VVAGALAAGLSWLVWGLHPDALDVSTDIVGFPVYANFNIHRYFWTYWVAAALLPLSAIAFFLLIVRLPAVRRYRPQGVQRLAPAEDEPASISWTTAGVALSVLAVGTIFGAETAVAAGADDGWLLAVLLPVVCSYAALAAGVAVVGARFILREGGFLDRLAAVNAVAATLAVAALHDVSEATRVTVESDDSVRSYSWLPAWLAALITILAVVAVVAAIRRAAPRSRIRAVQRWVVVLVTAPVGLFLLLAKMPGPGGPMDTFHEGELLGGAHLASEGAFPWSELFFTHGLLIDVLQPLLALNVFEDSRWAGFWLNFMLITTPLYWISSFFLAAYLFRRDWIFLVGTQLAVVLTLVGPAANPRFILQPIVLLLLAALLHRAGVLWAVGLVSAVGIQAIVTPESAYAVVACLGIVPLFELFYRAPGLPWRQTFRRTLVCAASAAVFVVVWAAFLLTRGALDDFVFYYRTFAPDHELTGGIPVSPDGSNQFWFSVYATAALPGVTFLFFALCTWARKPLRVEDWIMAATAIFVLLYYPKFLSRADGHVYQPYAVALPLFLYALYRIGGVGEAALRQLRATLRAPWLPARGVLSAVGVGLVIAYAPISLIDVARGVPEHFESTVPEQPLVERLGFTAPDAIDPTLVPDLSSVFDVLMEPGDTVFDLSNNPGLVHYLLGLPPATRYYHVSMAIRQETQADLVEELERTRPAVVVFTTTSMGLPGWDHVANHVRHYDVSEYVLRNYSPALVSHGFFLFTREPPSPAALERLGATPPEPDALRKLHFHATACDWGYSPNFLSTAPSSDRGAVEVPTHPLGAVVSVGGWAIDWEQPRPAAEVVATVDGVVVKRVRPSAERPDVVHAYSDERYLLSGFRLALFESELPPNWTRIRLYAISASGRAAELAYGAGAAAAPFGGGPAPPGGILVAGKRRLKVVKNADPGVADSGDLLGNVHLLELPLQTRRRFSWLEVESKTSLGSTSFLLSDQVADPGRGVLFSSLPRAGNRIAVQVGACPQWYGWPVQDVFLQSQRPGELRVRLLP
jgi:hypothetical protein